MNKEIVELDCQLLKKAALEMRPAIEGLKLVEAFCEQGYWPEALSTTKGL